MSRGLNSPLLGKNEESNKGLLENVRTPTDKVTGEQWCWVVKHTIVCSLLAFGVNFALTTLAMKDADEDVTLWGFPTGIWGAFALTVVLETTLNWFINGVVLTYEISAGKVPPLQPQALSWYPNTFSKAWWLDICDLYWPVDKEESFCSRWLQAHLRSACWMGLLILTLFPGGIGLSYWLYGEEDYNHFPQPQIMVGVFGAVLAYLTMPFWCLMALSQVQEKEKEDHGEKKKE